MIDARSTHENAESQDWPQEQSCCLRLRLLKFDTEVIKGWRQTSDAVVGQEREGADAAKGDMFLPSRPAERIIGISGRRAGM